MKEEVFIATYQTEWSALREWLHSSTRESTVITDFPASYRRLCHQLALAQARGFSSATVAELEELVALGHQRLYRASSRAALSRARETLLYDFPQACRQQWRFMLAATLLFVLPALLAYLSLELRPELIFNLLPPDMISEIESMYAPDAHQQHREMRSADDDVMMFGHYIQNNISIALRTFALGLLAMLGTIFALIYNGLVIGAVAGHLHNEGYAAQTLYPFVIGHGAFELTAIVLAGGCGLRLGYALIAPQRLRRIDALKHAAQALMPIIYGFTLMLLIAAGIEAFWSPRADIPNAVKFGVGALLWLAVLYFLARAGRPRAAL
jgi:uncharacterized membrane protein SpoIIM required for sporulation